MAPLNDENENQNEPESIRDTLAASFEAAETSNAAAAPATFDAAIGAEVTDGRARDESGRFAPKAVDAAPAAPAAAAPAVPAQTGTPAPAPEPAPQLTTWRKEFLPIQQKLVAGQALTADEAQKLAAYNVQREREYATGVSAHKAEAQAASQFTQAMAEFMPTLQQHNLNPAQWIQNLGRAHHTLAMGSPEQKLQMFTRLAQDYGVPLAAVQQAQNGQVDPLAMQLMTQMQQMQQNVQGITSWRQQQEDQAMQQEISKFSDAAQYPHFEQVRESMAQLLERGIAQTPDEAYAKAVRLNDDVWNAEQQRQASAQATSQAASKAAAAAKARQASGSIRSGASAASGGAATSNDIRASLESAYDQHSGGGRV